MAISHDNNYSSKSSSSSSSSSSSNLNNWAIIEVIRVEVFYFKQ